MSKLQRRSVLVIEDDLDTRELLPILFERAGFDVMPVASFAAAERALRRHTFDVVLSDVSVGVISTEHAWQHLETVRRLAAPTPVGLYTGWELRREDVARRGFAFYQRKPSTSGDLLALLAVALDLPPVSAAEDALVRRYFAAIEQGAWSTLGELCHDDVTYHVPGDDPRFSRTVVGRESFVGFAAETFRTFLDPRFEVLDVRALPRSVVARYRGRWRTAEGASAEVPGAVIFELRVDKLATIGVRVDLQAVASTTSDAATG